MSMTDPRDDSPSDFPLSRFISRFRQAKDEVRQRDVVAANSAPAGHVAEPTAPQPEKQVGRWPLPGLAPMSRVETSFGKVHAVALRKGDPVKTKSGEFRKIVWLNRVLLDQTLLTEKPDANPVRIRAGSLGHATPNADIMVSPRQVVCPGPKDTLSRSAEAAELERCAGVDRQPETGLSYTMFHLGEPAEVECDGVFLLFEPPKARKDD